jgi:mRNA interferase RelE/StbE
MFTIEFSKEAIKTLRAMPAPTARLIRTKLDELARDPRAMRNVKKLTDHPGYRLRVGDWRVVYLLREHELIIVVVKIAPRGGVYK